MPKTYVVTPGAAPRIGLNRIAIADLAPPQIPWANTGPRIDLNPVGVGVNVPNAGQMREANFQGGDDYIYTMGLAHCIAVCAVWNRVGNVFQHGFVAHVSSPHGAGLQNAIAAIDAIAPGAWIVVCALGGSNWADLIDQALTNANHAADHIWIYKRIGNSGFGIDQYGRFGQM